MGTSSGSIKTRENSITSIKSIPPSCILKIVKNLCTILIKNKENINYGTGFFLKIIRFIKMPYNQLSYY